jgi:putative AlgH/UPF0301 family transcriptional regulator
MISAAAAAIARPPAPAARHPAATALWRRRALEDPAGARHRWRVRAQAGDDDDAEPPQLMGDWRAFRAKLVAEDDAPGAAAAAGGWAARQTPQNIAVMRAQTPALAAEGDLWAHATGAAERGGLLLATPAVASIVGQQFLEAVILLTRHDVRGSAGLVLNRPTSLEMGRLPLAAGSSPSELCRRFADERLYCGGFDDQATVTMLHGRSGLLGADEIVPGMHLGGAGAAAALVAAGVISPSDCRFMAGGVFWPPDKLNAEVAAGAWWPTAAARALALKQCIGLPVPLWVETCRLVGGEHAAAAAAAYPEL